VGSTLRLMGHAFISGRGIPDGDCAARKPRTKRTELATFRASSGANLAFRSRHLAHALERALRSMVECVGEVSGEVTVASYRSRGVARAVSPHERLKLPT